MALVIFAGFVIGSSLVKETPRPKQTSIGPEDWIQLRKIQKKFDKRFQIKSDSVIILVDTVKNGSKSSTRIGYCTVDWIMNTTKYRHKYIQIKRNWWIKSSDLAREFLVFHELGHCEMYLGHITKFEHIMNPIIGVSHIENYMKNKESMLKSLEDIYRVAKKELTDIRVRQAFNF